MRIIEDKGEAIQKCIELYDTFNPVTHSIDTHLREQLGDTKAADAPKMHIFIQQIVYGTQKEKPALKAFIDVFYADNASSVSRADITLYRILAYMLIYRLNEMKFSKFKEFASTLNATVVGNILGYLFNKEWLYSTIRAELMKKIDLTYLEDNIFAQIVKHMPAAHAYMHVLNADAADAAAKEAEAEKAKADGTAGVTKPQSKPLTRPISPKLNKVRPPRLKEPEEISGTITAKPIPSYLNRRSLADVEEADKKRMQETKKMTMDKYKDAKAFVPREYKSGRSKLDLAKELEENETRELQFDNTYYHPAPDFNTQNAKVRLNVATILREDYLFKKQQAKDAALLKNYEEELRDPTEYYIWKKQMEDQDQIVKLKNVVARREQAKQSSEEAALAVQNMLDGNKEIAGMLREQAQYMSERKELEYEIEVIKKQETVEKISVVRDKAPGIAMEKVLQDRIENGVKVREELKSAAEAKIKEDEEYELEKADKIRKLKAVNSVHKEHIKVFDPTQVAGPVFLDQMSYMEMKERQEKVIDRERVREENKREDILEAKEKRAHDLEKRTLSIKHLRDIKAESNMKAREAKLAAQRALEEKKERAREQAAIHLRDELVEVRQKKADERKALKDEQDRIKRQQQYMGASKGAVEETSNRELQIAAERKISKAQKENRERLLKDALVKKKNKNDKAKVQREEITAKMAEEEQKSREFLKDKRRSVEKLKESVLMKKSMAKEGREQMERTRTVRVKHNLYAQRINDEIHDKTLRLRETLAKETNGY